MALRCCCCIVPLVVGLPFAHVGEITADGQDYRAYFTADYVWRRAVVIELAKGDVLPVNPYFSGDAAALLLDAARAHRPCSIDSPARGRRSTSCC